MKIQSLSGCCSAAHLYDIGDNGLSYINKSTLNSFLRLNTESSVKTILYMTNYGYFKRLGLYLNLGFKTVGSYRGHSGGKVYIMKKRIRK